MIPFCLLWTPAFYIFWRAVRPENINSRAVLAFIVGSCEAVARFFVPYMAYSGGLGLSRYISAYVDYTSLPVLLPLAAALLISRFRPNAGITDFTGFTLLSMVPVALACFVPWSASHDPLRLTLTPLLWTALAVAFYPLSVILRRCAADGGPKSGPTAKIAVLFGILAFSLLPPLVWQFFFRNQNLVGALLLLPALAPMLSICALLLRKKRLAERGSR